jgi:putative ribosome biogenesis GTPase RsgA
VAGDLVKVSRTEACRGVIESVLPRTSNLSRVATGGRSTRQVIASNLDRFLLVVAARDPAPSTGFIDRALVMAASGGIEEIVICVNKIDVDTGDSRRPLVELYRDLSSPCSRSAPARGPGWRGWSIPFAKECRCCSVPRGWASRRS